LWPAISARTAKGLALTSDIKTPLGLGTTPLGVMHTIQQIRSGHVDLKGAVQG